MTDGANSPPLDVVIEVDTGVTNTFAASGPAVEEGLVCGSGTVADVGFNGGGFQSGRGFNVQVLKHFTCDGKLALSAVN